MQTILSRNNRQGAIPQPPALPWFGNAFTVDRNALVQGFSALTRQYGPIIQLDMMGRKILLVSDPSLVGELCDQSRFEKSLKGPVGLLRRLAGDGLFTAATGEPNWKKAHNILLPNFSLRAMQTYHPVMVDVAGQLARKWEQLGPDAEIDVTHDMTSLTLETIGLCGFGYRFNSFEHDRPHPFIGAMLDVLSATMQIRGLPREDVLFPRRERRVRKGIRTMNVLVDEIIRMRRASTDQTAKDLLGAMLSGIDRDTGEKLDDLNIRNQILTFLIAGHETTSGLLSFALHAMLKHPDVLARCYEEVDDVLGKAGSPPTYLQVQRLGYLSQVLKETLRLWPTAPAFSVCPREDTTLAGRYHLKKGQHITVLLPMLHRNQTVWGARAEEFDPGRFAGDAEQRLPAHSYKPFGNGERACIGRQFAMHEALLVLAMILQRFELSLDPVYALRIKESLTIKPDGLRIRARPRPILRDSAAPTIKVAPPEVSSHSNGPALSHGGNLLVLFGSNMGTAEETARRIASDGKSRGFDTSIAPLDDYTGKLPDTGLVAIVCASYNGNPPDNAVRFCAWLNDSGAKPDQLSGLRYIIFGCGHHDWATTFQSVPRQIDERLTALGARRICERGEGDAGGDFDGQFLNWYRPVWDHAAREFGLTLRAPARGDPLFSIEILEPASAAPKSGHGAMPVRMLANRELQKPADSGSVERSTRHIEIELPAGASYRAGDHMGVIPENDPSLVDAVAAHFGLAKDTWIALKSANAGETFLPVGKPIAVGRLLGSFVELQAPATRSQIAILAEYSACPHTKSKLLAWSGGGEIAGDDYQREILAPRKTVFDLLCAFRACNLPFNVYLEMLSPLAPRYYSISSSPLLSPGRCSVTVGVLDEPARSGNGAYKGVCSNHLARIREGDSILGFVKDTKSPFRLPDDATIPLIMVAAGTGLAPFRGFLQERLEMMRRGDQVASSLLFFGCRSPQRDLLYEDELREFEARGLTRLYPAFSRAENCPKTWVQDRILQEQDEVWALIQSGAKIYVCGDANRMAPAVRGAFATIYRNRTGLSAEEAEHWLAALDSAQRYLVDVWPSN